MKRKGAKEHKILAEVSETVRPVHTIVKKVFTFLPVMGGSFCVTLFLVWGAPRAVVIVKQIKFPTFSLFSSNLTKKIMFTGNENYEYVEPMFIKEAIDKQDLKVLLIDTRSRAEYENGHIKGAVHIPLYEDYKRPYGTHVNQMTWVQDVRKAAFGSREIVLYGFYPRSDILLVGRDVLKKQGIRSKILPVGYSEWVGGVWNWIAGGELNGTLDISSYIERNK